MRKRDNLSSTRLEMAATRATSKTTHNSKLMVVAPNNTPNRTDQDHETATIFSNLQMGRLSQHSNTRTTNNLFNDEVPDYAIERLSSPPGQSRFDETQNELAPGTKSTGNIKLRQPSSSASVSPSSLQSLTTDSDSFQGEAATIAVAPTTRNSSSSSPNEHLSSPTLSPLSLSNQQHSTSQTKSPILIKYNYYDYNGERQENHDIQTSGNSQQHRVPRQLSPTFKQSLDQIVRSSQKYLVQQQQHQSTSPVSPRGSPNGLNQQTMKGQNGAFADQHQNAYTMTLLARRYKLSSYEHRCLRCSKTVYQMDKVGPLKDFTFYHQNCFKCRECGTKLTLKTYFNNQHSSTDQEVYCHRHCPKTPAGRLDNQSVGIRAALNAPKVFDPIHQEQFLAGVNGANQHQFALNHHQAQVDSRALHIQHAVKQTKLQAIYKHSQVDKKISQFLNRRLEYLEPKQKMLEMRHREEEDQLFKVFEQKWLQEESSIRDQIREEWQRELNKLLEKYKRQLSLSATNLNNATTQTSNNNNNNIDPTANHNHSHYQDQPTSKKSYLMDQKQKLIAQQQQLQQQQQQQQKTNKSGRMDFHRLPAADNVELGGNYEVENNNIEAGAEQRMIELERMNLEKTMTIKLDRKKETLKRKLKEFERQATAELVEKQSREMITLISLKLEEFKEEQKRKIGSDLEQFEAIESLANHLGASLQVSSSGAASSAAAAVASNGGGFRLSPNSRVSPSRSGGALMATTASGEQPRQGAPPLPKAPQLSKMELYNSDQPDELFRDIDELAINVAKEDQRTFTDLVHHLTRHCLTDVEKVRAIFRWITVKNLNTMEFDSSIKPDTPLGLLRGIKQGSESYHVLFKRLCSYAGLHCVVIKGYSKSAGYQPGVRFEGNRFRNSWNAVYVAGAWRFVQCNWGARHLVSVAVMQDKNSNSNKARNNRRSCQQQQVAIDLSASGNHQAAAPLVGVNLGRRGLASVSAMQNNGSAAIAHYDTSGNTPIDHHHHHHNKPKHLRSGAQLSPGSPVLPSPVCSSSASSSCSYSSSSSCSSPATSSNQHHHHLSAISSKQSNQNHSHRPNKLATDPKSPQDGHGNSSDSLRYEYDDHYFLTDPDEFIYEFFPLAPEWQLLRTRPISLQEFEQLPFVRSLFFKYGLYFAQPDIRSVLYTNSSGATTIKIGMPTHMIPSLIFHYNLKYFDSDLEHHDGISLKRFVMQSVESGNGTGLATANGDSSSDAAGGQNLLSNIVSFRVHVPENGAYILDIFANSTTPNQYITGEPMKFKSVCKFKIIARNLKTVMVPLPDCASGEYGPMKATRLFGIIPLTHENGLISVQNDKRFLEIQFRMTIPLLDFMASLHKNGYDERQLSKLIKIFIDGDIVFIAIKFHEDGQYGLDIYTRDNQQQQQQQQASQQQQLTVTNSTTNQSDDSGLHQTPPPESKKQLLTHCCKYLINVKASAK